MGGNDLPKYEDVLKASENISGHVSFTPLVASAVLNRQVGGNVIFKTENLQRTGSFKFRGAYNKLLSIPKQDRQRGVVACSSGNHAQGVALAAQILNIPATIVMPLDAPLIKLNRTREMGARVVLYDRESEDREKITSELCESLGAILVHPYNDKHIIAGQGTSALEVVSLLKESGHTVDNYLVCTGGGGLTAGTALALEGISPKTKLYTVEPEGFDDHLRSFSSGVRERNEKLGGSICDALLADQPGEITFEINKSRVEKGLVVSEKQVMEAVAFAFHEMKLVVEPGGAVALAAIMVEKVSLANKLTVAVLSGGNIDAATMAAYVEIVQTQKSA